MKLRVLGSGSTGNCYILENDTDALIIEAGVPFLEVKKALNFDIMKIVGLVASHTHKDHFGYFEQFKKAGIRSMCFGETFPEYDANEMKDYCLRMGNFMIKPFPLVHDVPCYGIYIIHPDIGKLLFITDTEYVKQRFVKQKVNHIMVEANYSKDLISDNPEKRQHVLTGHMEIDTTCRFIEKNRTSELLNLILLHLSENSSDMKSFKAKAEKVARCPVYVAQKGVEVDLRIVPF